MKLSLAVLVLMCVGISAQDDCPDPILECVVNPPSVICEPECVSGFECTAFVFDGIATSTCIPAVSETCSDLDCETLGLACEEEPTGSRCVALSVTCEELEPVCAANSSVCIIEEPFEPHCVGCVELCATNFTLCVDPLSELVCRPALSCEELEPVCRNRSMECMELSGLFVCLPPSSCEGVVCGEFERCLVVQDPDLPISFTQCIDASFGLTCDDLRCSPNASLCVVTAIPSLNVSSLNVSLARCLSDEAADALFSPPLTCESVGAEICGSNDVCLNLLQDGEIINIFCATVDCKDDLSRRCPNGTMCLSGIPNLPKSTSACIPLGLDIMFETTCTTRVEDCSGEDLLGDSLTCEEAALETGDVIGTFCSARVPLRSCDPVDCAAEVEGGVCQSTFVSTSPETTLSICDDPGPLLNVINLLQ